MKNYDFNLINADTDSIMISKNDGSPFSQEEQISLLNELNNLFPEHINWEDDGYFKVVVILKAKNYILLNADNKIKVKGSGMMDQKKEKALKDMINEFIDCLLFDKQHELVNIYHKYIREALDVKDIMRWSAKKTISKPILACRNNPEARLNESKVYDAVSHTDVQEGDKVYLYPNIISTSSTETVMKNGKVKIKTKQEKGLKLASEWNGDHDVDKLIERVYSTIEIFSTVIDMNNFIDYGLKKNKQLLTNFSE